MSHDPSYRGPLLGATLRLAHRTIMTEIQRRFAEAGITDLHPPHFALTQPLYERPEGMRSTELAAYARISKQAVKETVDDLVRLGYVERVPDPTDGRAHRVRFTAHGRDTTERMRDVLNQVEAEVEAALGPERIQDLRETLHLLQGTFEPENRPAAPIS